MQYVFVELSERGAVSKNYEIFEIITKTRIIDSKSLALMTYKSRLKNKMK